MLMLFISARHQMQGSSALLPVPSSSTFAQLEPGGLCAHTVT